MLRTLFARAAAVLPAAAPRAAAAPRSLGLARTRWLATAPAGAPAPGGAQPAAGAPVGNKGGSLLAAFTSASFVVAVTGGAAYLGRPFESTGGETSADGHSVELQNNNYDHENILAQYFYRARDRLKEFWATYGNPTQEHLLPPAPDMLLNNYVLVLTVEDLLIHQDWAPMSGWRTVKRPHLDMFLEYCLNLFGEVILFSDKQLIESATVLQKLDPNNAMHKLFRSQQRYTQGEHVKDLSLLDRDLKKVLVLDIRKEGFRLQPHNGLVVKPYSNDPSDNTLLELIPLLQAIVQLQVPDVRDIVKNFSNTEDIAAALAARRHFLQEEARQKRDVPVPEMAVQEEKPKRSNKLAKWLLPSK
eukprot:m.234402 g.234402  ORF g.234402 m.234402 type:complete len:359 (+) comp12657_c0_seq1:80-1156(+)